MTIQTTLHDGNKERTTIFRKVYKGKSYAQLVENFYSFKSDQKWGKLIQLKGKEKITLHTFGIIE